MQKGSSLTWCAGFSKGSPSSLPMKKLPPGIWIIPAGHPTGAGATLALGAGADALARGAGAPEGAPCLEPRKKTAPPMRATAPSPSPTKSPILPAPGSRPVVDTDERLLTGTPETAGNGSDGDTTVGAVPMAWLTGGGMSAPTDRGDMLVIRIGAIASA